MTPERRPVYLDCNASTPVEPAVLEAMIPWFSAEPGNPSSWTHEYGMRARAAVEHARRSIAEVVRARPEDVVFTSGATEANNLAVRGLAEWGIAEGKTHVVATEIEHKAVLEPLRSLSRRGFDVSLVHSDEGGRIRPKDVLDAVREDTLLVSVMAVSNVTGVRQPVAEIAEGLNGRGPWLHSDAAQAFGRDVDDLCNERLDMVSVSGHKVHGPMGIGALIIRRRLREAACMEPSIFGGGQERGLRSGSVPVPLVVGLGVAAEQAVQNRVEREASCLRFRATLLQELEPLAPVLVGDQASVLPHVVALRVPGVSAGAFIAATREMISVSTGAACSSAESDVSHVFTAMGLDPSAASEAVRLSWFHGTPDPDWRAVRSALGSLL